MKDYSKIVIPQGTNKESIIQRQAIIDEFYKDWFADHPTKMVWNNYLGANIKVEDLSKTTTAFHASVHAKSTIAVLQLDSILALAKDAKHLEKKNNQAQKKFDYMLSMECILPALGRVRLTIGVIEAFALRRGGMKSREYIQYCITGIEI